MDRRRAHSVDIGAEDNQGAAYFFGNERGGATPSVEGAPIILTSPLKLLNGSFQFSFTNTPGRLLTALVSTNIALPLSNWASLGSLTGTSPGQFQFTDPQATNGPHCFYRVRSP